MHATNYVSFLIGLLPLALAQEPTATVQDDATVALQPAMIAGNPTPTPHMNDIADAQVLAIVPTAAGEIGINPVDLPPVSHAPIGADTTYLTDEGGSTKWIGGDKWFSGSLTVGAGQPGATGHAIPKGFQVTVAGDGSIEIGLSQWVHDKLESIAEGLPGCPAKRRRQAVSACTRRRTYQFAEEIAQDSELMEQIEGLSSELSQAVGGEGYAADLIGSGRTLTFGGTELVGDALASLGAIPALAEASPLATGIFGSVVLTAANFNGIMKSGDKPGPMAWKFGAAKPEAIPVPAPKPNDDGGKEVICIQDGITDAPCPSKDCEGKQDGDTSKCTVGQYKGCPCVWPGEQFSQPFYEEWETIEEIFNSISTELEVECDPLGDSSGLPESLFRGGIYGGFCEDVEKNKANGVTWLVDHKGVQIPNKVRRSDSDQPWLPRALGIRSPPVRADDWRGYTIELKWEPTEGGGGCPKSCQDTLLGVSNSPCGHAGPHQDSMAGESKLNVLCGEYTITVKAPENPPPPPYRTNPAASSPSPTQQCWKENEFGEHGPVNEEQVRKGARIFCEADHKLTMETATVYSMFAPDNRYGREPLGHLESWFTFYATRDKEKCGKDHGEVSVRYTESIFSCENLLVNNFKECKNGETGGYIKDGCVTYMFWPYNDTALDSAILE